MPHSFGSEKNNFHNDKKSSDEKYKEATDTHTHRVREKEGKQTGARTIYIPNK